MNNFKGVLLIVLSTFMFGSYGIWSRLIGNSFGSLFQGWTRGLILCILLLPILIFKKELVPIARKDWKWLIVFLIFTSITQAPVYYAFNHISIGLASLLFFTSTLVTMYFFGIFFLEEKLTKIKIVSLFLAIVGMCFIFSFSIGIFSLFAALMSIINGIGSGGEISSSKKLSGRYSVLYLSWLSWTVIMITNAPLSILIGEVQHLPSLTMPWFYQLCYTLVSLVGFWSVMAGLKDVQASVGGLIGLLEIVFSIALGFFIFNELLTFRIIVGGLLIIIAAALPNIFDLIKKQS